MDSNLKLILEEFEKLKGQFVITESHLIERLLAIGEDEWDYYYITYNGRKLIWNTCVGRIMPLRGYLREKDYAHLVHMAKLNHCDQPNYFGLNGSPEILELNQAHKEELLNIDEKIDGKFLTEVCWDLN
jgi:hypothetical protein